MIIIFSFMLRKPCIFIMTVILTYIPPITTDNGYYRTIFSDLFASDKMYRRREASACPISLSTKQGSRCYHFSCMWYDAAGYPNSELSILMRMLYHLSYRGRTNVALCEKVSFSEMKHITFFFDLFFPLFSHCTNKYKPYSF